MRDSQTSKHTESLGALLGAGTGLYFLWRYLRLPLTVALLAWCVGAMIAPMARWISKRCHLPRRLCGVLCLLLVLAGLGTLLSFGLGWLCQRVVAFTVWLGENRGMLFEQLGEGMDMIGHMLSRLPFLSRIEEGEITLSFQKFLNERLGQLILRLGSTVTVGVGRILAATPRALIASIVTLVACVYTSMDYERMRERILRLLGVSWRERVDRAFRCVPRLLLRTLRAYLALMLITFAELWIGLSILGVRHAALLSVLIALVDLLPILGTGTVLIPWAIGAILSQQTAMGVGLVILYAVVTVVRQLVEPYFLSKSMGVHPFVSLLAMLAGLELFGFWGMILSPMIVLLIRTFVVSKDGVAAPKDT